MIFGIFEWTGSPPSKIDMSYFFLFWKKIEQAPKYNVLIADTATVIYGHYTGGPVLAGTHRTGGFC